MALLVDELQQMLVLQLLSVGETAATRWL